MQENALWMGKVDGAVVVRIDDVLGLLRSESDLGNSVARKMEAQVSGTGSGTGEELGKKLVLGMLAAGASTELDKVIKGLEEMMADEVKAADVEVLFKADGLLKLLRRMWHDTDVQAKRAIGEVAWRRDSEVEKREDLMRQATLLAGVALGYDNVIKGLEEMVADEVKAANVGEKGKAPGI